MRPELRKARLRNLILTVHIATAVGVFGADLVLISLGIAGWNGAGPLIIFPAYIVATSVVAPLAFLALASGIALALLTEWRLFKYLWVTIKLGIAALLNAMVLFVLVPKLAQAAEKSAGLPPGAAFEGQRMFLIAPSVAAGLLLVALALAVFKPPWRVPSSARAQRHSGMPD